MLKSCFLRYCIFIPSTSNLPCLTILCDVLVEFLHWVVVSQQVQTLTVGFPQELHPWSQDGAVSTVLSVLTTDSAQQQAGGGKQLSGMLTHWPLRNGEGILKNNFSNSFYKLISHVFSMKLVLGECHRIQLMNKSTLVQVMAWCHQWWHQAITYDQATSQYLSQCWPRSMSPFGITRPQWVNTLAPGRCGFNLKLVIFKLILRIDILSYSYEIALRWMTQDLTDDQSTQTQTQTQTFYWTTNGSSFYQYQHRITYKTMHIRIQTYLHTQYDTYNWDMHLWNSYMTFLLLS